MGISKSLRIEKTTRRRRSKKHLKRTREEMIETYLPLVGEVAEEVRIKSSVDINYEELITTGLSALIEAINNYEPNCSVSFATYCRKVIEDTMVDVFGLEDLTEGRRGYKRPPEEARGEMVGFEDSKKGQY